jgi:DNA-binding IclR family transcriptional regulator
MNQHRIMRVIKLMEFLKHKPRPVQAMVRYLGISERSVYRYLKMYEQLGYKLIKDNYKKYYLK